MASDRRLKEYLKIGLRSVLRRYNFDLVRNPYITRLTTTLNWLSIDNVVDVGANIGQYASALRSSGYRGQIYSCEPVSDAFAHLARRAADDSRWTALHTALGAAPATAEINVSANSYSSSVLPMTAAHLRAAPDSRFVRLEQVSVTTVADLAAQQRIVPSRTLLKAETQGYESQVLDGAAGMLSEFAAIQLERPSSRCTTRRICSAHSCDGCSITASNCSGWMRAFPNRPPGRCSNATDCSYTADISVHVTDALMSLRS